MIQCPHRPLCDGCPHFENPSEGHAQVLAELRQIFTTHGLQPPTAFDTDGLSAQGYRNRARMVVKDSQLGFYRRGTREFVAITQCAVHRPALEAFLNTVRRGLSEGLKAPRFVDLRINESDEGLLTLIFDTPATDHIVEQWSNFLATEKNLALHTAVSTSDAILPPQPHTPSLKMMGLDCPADAFFQVNEEVLQAMHQTLRSWYEGQTVVDMYCGVGTHSIAGLGKLGQNTIPMVYGFDFVDGAIDAARANAARYQINADFRALRDSDSLPWEAFSNAFIIINPGRQGMSPGLAEWLRDHAQGCEIAYISCEPRTLMRDVERLSSAWTVDETHVFDMMPRTGHVEIMMRLRPRPVTDSPSTSTQWFGLVKGAPPHGRLPSRQGQPIFTLKNLKKREGFSVVLIRASEEVSQEDVRERLRVWGYPVLGDATFGDKALNLRFARDHYLDAPAMRPTDQPLGALLWIARLPMAAVNQELKDVANTLK